MIVQMHKTLSELDEESTFEDMNGDALYELDGFTQPALKKDNKSANSNNSAGVKKPAFEPPKRKAAGSAYKPRGYADKNVPPVVKSAMPSELKFKNKL